MTSPTAPRLKVTYATLRADNEELHAAYEAGLERAKARLGAHHRNFVGGRERDGEGTFEVRSPIDRDVVVGTFARGTRQDVRDAVAAARAAQPAWAATPWHERLAILRRAADIISERQMEYAGLMAIEVGKNRLEALGEVEETADLIRYYAKTWEDNEAYDHPMDNLGDAAVHTRSILRSHGVFAVISPFNFPMALAGGPTSAALIAGNTVVFKPASAGAMSGVTLMEAYRAAGLPDGVVNLVMGPGETVGAELRENQDVDGIVFTGSYEVGFDLFRTFSTRYPRPCIVEMGGKNPAIVSRRADLEEAAEGIMRSAFGFGGQKCSANSRVYVERPVHDELVRLLVEKTEKITIGDPLKREHWLGPIIDGRAVDRHQGAVAEARRDGTVFTGGEHLTDGGLDRGFYVEPTVVGNLPASHRLFQDELFAPLTAVAAVDSLDEAIRLSNESLYGLTAGVYSEDPAEVEKFLTEIHAGVLYVNRRAGATTGAWPGVQAFGGWKGSGSTGKAGLSMYYVAQFLREQSHTVVD
ncbi:MAG: aldehyde dehydrogenase, 1-pyrroline-5-carboxylate dehydrogenase [Chloroflexi bacterium CSP1-4]|nr:MAG: aldehyde dehydrogenase, 1-pyrroline-5-carboxylate dehydrogenase [Chloroflexi bacterium CSP1-4]